MTRAHTHPEITILKDNFFKNPFKILVLKRKMKEDLALVDAEEVADRYKRVKEWVGQQSLSVVQFQDMPVNRSEVFAALTELLGSLDYDNIL